MKLSYILRYAWMDLWHRSNRPFSAMNMVAISISVAITVLLTGGFLAFRKNSDKLMSGKILKIEVTSREEGEIPQQIRETLVARAEGAAVFWWTPTVLMFYGTQGLKGGIGGQTVALKDPSLTSLKDVRNFPLKFWSRQELGTRFDEIALIVPFSMLKQLGYLPSDASQGRPESWVKAGDVRDRLTVFFKQSDTGEDGTLSREEWQAGRFPLETGSREFAQWDRNQDGLVSPQEIYSLYFPDKLKIRIPDDIPVDIEIPVVGVIPDTAQSRYLLTKDCYHILSAAGWKREYCPFLVDRHGNPLFPDTQPTGDNPIPERLSGHAETHASVYAADRSQLLPLIEKIEALGLKADCPLEEYLKKYQQQETFFIVAAGFICLSLFFFAGVVLFANFHGLILRKFPEIGILKACGTPKAIISKIFAMQAGIICAISIGLGIYCGNWCGTYMSRYIQEEMKNSETPELGTLAWFDMPTEWIVILFVLGMLFGRLVTAFPVRKAISIDPDQVIRV